MDFTGGEFGDGSEAWEEREGAEGGAEAATGPFTALFPGCWTATAVHRLNKASKKATRILQPLLPGGTQESSRPGEEMCGRNTDISYKNASAWVTKK